MTKVSFPEHMRRMQAALDALLAECQAYDDGVCDVGITVSDGVGPARYAMRVYLSEGPGPEWRESEDVPEAAIRLLHDVAGTEPPPF